MNTREAELLNLPYNIRSIVTRTQNWNGVRIDITKAHYAEGEILHPLGYEDKTRLSVNLDEVGGITEPRLSRTVPCPVEHKPRYMAFAPAGTALWGYASKLGFCYDATVMFDLEALEERLQHGVSRSRGQAPRLRYAEPRIWTLVNMLVAIPDGDSSYQLYGDSLTAAIFAIAFESRETHRRSGALAPWQLNRVVEYMTRRLPRQVELQELASLVNLSQWHFARAFKASTGMSPYQWQLDARLKEARHLLLTTDLTIEDIAIATGFSDHMHLIRRFRSKTGMPPAAWRRMHKS
ncbi:helix-turn-helix transcriptional regulator [Azospirillum sp. YIM B02556]|uniref:Helix-turn-helix transcriptional regulator n=1 Tax=Azospirillum endophyticum TaxID=2800326 RepID=A0ABS1FAG6_9PROT|nr:AraC family transcriptional regulator [Azospirillum endophyticum]MBK1840415.1 helix-turn-helix transcriptional regulator [Azospirillum endophyticum]